MQTLLSHSVAMPSRNVTKVKVAIAAVLTGGRFRAASSASVCAPATGTFRMNSLTFMMSPAANPPSALRKNGRVVAIEPQPAKALALLLGP